MSKTIYLLIGGGLVAIGALLIWLLTRNLCTGEIDLAKLDPNKHLRRGVTGPEVCALQAWLNEIFDADIKVTGRFNRATEKALIANLDEVSIQLGQTNVI